MQDKSRPDPSRLPATLDFTPVPRKTRRTDGWTPDRQRRFIAALAETGSVTAAARAVNMAHASAYALYHHPEGASFRAAWDHALSLGVQRLHDVAMERIVSGVPSPIFYKGEQVGERRLFSDHLLVQLLRHHAGAHGDTPVGRRSRATIERHAAENCPVCRERREAEAAAEAARPGPEEEEAAFADKLFTSYAHKVAAERRHRLAGEVIAADFYLRQITALEMMIETAGFGERVKACWGEGAAALLRARPTELARELDAIKRAIWGEAGEPPRPLLRLEDGAMTHANMRGGPTVMARHKVQAEAQARIAAAQAEWEAAATEAGWQAWCAARRGE